MKVRCLEADTREIYLDALMVMGACWTSPKFWVADHGLLYYDRYVNSLFKDPNFYSWEIER